MARTKYRVSPGSEPKARVRTRLGAMVRETPGFVRARPTVRGRLRVRVTAKFRIKVSIKVRVKRVWE